MKTIKFTSDHIKKIKAGEKTSTLRTIKKYHLIQEDSVVQIHGTDYKLHFTSRNIVEITPSGIRHFDSKESVNRKRIAELEGFDTWQDLISWFENRGYNLPQAMFFYRFEKPSNVDSSLEAYQ